MALEELNYEYIALKLGQGCKEDMGAALTSIRSRYNDIRAKVRTAKVIKQFHFKKKALCVYVSESVLYLFVV